MKFHFFGSLTGNKSNYRVIFEILEELGCEPITRHVFKRSLADIKKESPSDSERYVKKMLGWIKRADFIVFEVTREEVSIGYELMLSLEKSKPVMVLFDKNVIEIPPTLRGVNNEKLLIYDYETGRPDKLKRLLKTALLEVKKQRDIRFTLLLSPQIISFLNEISYSQGVPKSVFLRNLIEVEMRKRGKK